MQRNVNTFGIAIRNGNQPALYTYDANKIPLGEFEATLDFKTWSKRIIAINCYFTKADTHEKFVVTVYHNNKTNNYSVRGCAIDISECAVGVKYYITIAKSNNGKIILAKIARVVL